MFDGTSCLGMSCCRDRVRRFLQFELFISRVTFLLFLFCTSNPLSRLDILFEDRDEDNREEDDPHIVESCS